MTSVRTYGEMRLLSIECASPDEIDDGAGATHIRVVMPPARMHQIEMARRGFVLVDREIDTTINLAASKLDFASMVRIEPIVASDRRDEVLDIASLCFTTDSRFHTRLELDAPTARCILASRVEELDRYYLIDIKGRAAGFLALTGDDAQRTVYLAAVLEKYRLSGAALSLYAAAARDCRANGVKRLCGTISTSNPPAVNLYSFLGAVFSDPRDVYLKEV